MRAASASGLRSGAAAILLGVGVVVLLGGSAVSRPAVKPSAATPRIHHREVFMARFGPRSVGCRTMPPLPVQSVSIDRTVEGVNSNTDGLQRANGFSLSQGEQGRTGACGARGLSGRVQVLRRWSGAICSLCETVGVW